MQRSKRFEPIRQIAENTATDLSRALGAAGRKVADCERQYAQLKTYRDEYVKNSADGAGTMDALKLQNYRMFLERLGDAIRQQLTLLDYARADYENRRVAWSVKRVEAESLGRVIDRFRKEEQYSADQREQREGDDAAMRICLARLEADPC